MLILMMTAIQAMINDNDNDSYIYVITRDHVNHVGDNMIVHHDDADNI